MTIESKMDTDMKVFLLSEIVILLKFTNGAIIHDLESSLYAEVMDIK